MMGMLGRLGRWVMAGLVAMVAGLWVLLGLQGAARRRAEEQERRASAATAALRELLAARHRAEVADRAAAVRGHADVKRAAKRARGAVGADRDHFSDGMRE